MSKRLGEARIRENLRVYAIGDIHGCLTEMKQLLSLIEDDLARKPVDRHRIIFVGDYTDRGPQNPETLDFIIQLQDENPNTTFLAGNHDKGMIDFVTKNGRNSRMFFRYGGASTLRQYGVHILKLVPEFEWKEPVPGTMQVERIVKEALAKMDHRHLDFLNSLSYHTEQDDYFFCHAGIRPGRSLSKQKIEDLIWIRDEFLLSEKLHEKVIVHGHTSRREVDIQPNRINIDTRCHDTGVLTCAVLERNEYRFLQTG